MKRRTKLGRSRRARLLDSARRALVERILHARPRCERCRQKRSEHVHEIKTRGRGGDFLDPKNCAAVCADCHDFLHTHPKIATEEGFLISQWDGA